MSHVSWIQHVEVEGLDHCRDVVLRVDVPAFGVRVDEFGYDLFHVRPVIRLRVRSIRATFMQR